MATKPIKLKQGSIAVKNAIKDPTKFKWDQIEVGGQVFKKSDGFKGLAGLGKQTAQKVTNTTTKFDKTLQAPEGKLQPGVFIDPNTGATIDTRDVSGKSPYSTFQEYQSDKDSGFAIASALSGDGASYEAPEDSPFESIEEEAKYRVSGEIGETADLMAELGIETYQAPPGTLEEMIDQFYAQQQKSDLESLEKQQAFETLVDERALKAAGETAESQMAAVEASLMPGREGFVGGTAVPAVKEFQQRVAVEMDTAKKRVELAKQQRATAMENLKRAQDRGDFELADRIKGQIAQAESDIRTETSNLIELEQRNAQIALDTFQTLGADQRASYATFQNLMETGVQMDATSLINMANSLGLPADVVNSAYIGMQSIRDDKKLSVQEKQIGIQQEMNKLRDYQLGLSNQNAKKVDDFLKLSQSGNYTPEQLQSFAVAMDIPNDQNPVWVAEQKMLAAEAKIAQAEANGEMVSPIDRLNYAIEMKAYMDSMGLSGVYAPTDSKYEVSATQNGIRVGVEEGQRFTRGQCGEFVNDVLGIGVGDLLSDKTKFIDESVVVPQPGMAFVMGAQGDAAKYGHIGIVESVNPDGSFNTVESNANGDEKITREHRSVNEVIGFIKPKKSEYIGGEASTQFGAPGEYTPSQTIDFQTYLSERDYPSGIESKSEKEAFKMAFNEYVSYLQSPDTPITDVLSSTIGGKNLLANELDKLTKFNITSDQLEVLEDNIMDANTGPILGILKSANPYDDKAKLIKAQLIQIVPGLARGVFGEVGVLTDADIERYTQTLPNLQSTAAQKELLLQMTKDMIARSAESTLRGFAAGGRDVSGYEYLIEGLAPPLSQQEEVVEYQLPGVSAMGYPEIID